MPNISEINGYLINADTASYAVTASFLSGSVTSASYAATASFVATASWALTSSLATLATTADTAKTVITIANTTNATFYPTFVDSNNTPTAASEVVYTSDRFTFNPSTRVLTISGGIIALGAIITGSLNVTGSLAVIGAITSSIFSGSSFTGSLFGTASWATNALTASFLLGSITSASFASTASFVNPLRQNVTITGSLVATGSITASAFNFVSSSLTQSRVLLDSNGFTDLNISGLTPDVRARSPLLRIYGTYTTGSANTTGQNHILVAHINPTFNPTNNSTSVFNTLTLEPQFLNVNATGSARGLLITPGFAGSHPNWRSVEWDNTEGYGLYGTGTARNYLNGSLGIGTLTPSASFHTTGSGIIVGSLALGTSSLGSTENTLVVGLPPAGGTGEGGQILLQASGGLYTSASMLDNYQNKFRVLRGTNAGSDAFKFQVDMQTGQMQAPNYNSATALTGSVIAGLGVDNNGNILTTTVPGAILTNNFVGAGFTNPIVTYMPFGTTTVSGNESQRQVASPVAGIIKNFYLRTNNTAPATSFTTWTVRVNGVNTGITLVISGGQAAGLYSNTINSASVTVGAEISLQVSTSVANSSQVNQYSLGIYPS